MHTVALKDIAFPVFVVGSTKPLIDGKISYFLYAKDLGDSDEAYKITVLDDRELEYDSLALRRLALKAKNVPLKKLSKTIFFISDFIKLAKPNLWFIDSKGAIFNYRKSRSVPLSYHKISKIIAMPQGGAIVEVQGVPTRFKTLFYPPLEVHYAGVLKIDHSFLLYGLYDKKYKTSTRKI